MKGMYYALGLLLVFGAVFAAAATINLNGGTIQFGEDLSLTCDDAVRVAGWGLETDGADAGKVFFVRIGGISSSCFGNDLFVNITGTGGAVLTDEAAPVTINAATETVAFQTPVLAKDITDLHVWIEGPESAP